MVVKQERLNVHHEWKAAWENLVESSDQQVSRQWVCWLMVRMERWQEVELVAKNAAKDPLRELFLVPLAKEMALGWWAIEKE